MPRGTNMGSFHPSMQGYLLSVQWENFKSSNPVVTLCLLMSCTSYQSHPANTSVAKLFYFLLTSQQKKKGKKIVFNNHIIIGD